MNPPTPIPNAYWVDPGRLLAGEYPGDMREDRAREKLRSFLAAGVRYYLDLTHEGESGLTPYAPLLEDESGRARIVAEYVRMPIADVSVPGTPEDMTAILDAIDYALARERVVYVHCWGGAGRTGTVVGCHLVRRGLSGERALARVSELWRTVEKHWRSSDAPQTEEQRAWVREWMDPAAS